MSSGCEIPLGDALQLWRELSERLDVYGRRFPYYLDAPPLPGREDSPCDIWTPAGSVRRAEPLVRDLEVVCLPAEGPLGNGAIYNVLDNALAAGLIEHPARKCWGEKARRFMYRGLQVDVYLTTAANFGVIHLIRTGGRDFATTVVKRLKDSGRFRVAGGYLRPYFEGERKDSEVDAMPYYNVPHEGVLLKLAFPKSDHILTTGYYPPQYRSDGGRWTQDLQ